VPLPPYSLRPLRILENKSETHSLSWARHSLFLLRRGAVPRHSEWSLDRTLWELRCHSECVNSRKTHSQDGALESNFWRHWYLSDQVEPAHLLSSYRIDRWLSSWPCSALCESPIRVPQKLLPKIVSEGRCTKSIAKLYRWQLRWPCYACCGRENLCARQKDPLNDQSITCEGQGG
jgi:hypothetical protein